MGVMELLVISLVQITVNIQNVIETREIVIVVLLKIWKATNVKTVYLVNGALFVTLIVQQIVRTTYVPKKREIVFHALVISLDLNAMHV